MPITEHARRYLLDEGIRPETIIKVGSSMKEVLEKQKESIEKVVYRDKLDNAVEILFSNQTTNLFLDDELFKAEIPRGYDIVRE